MNTIPKNFIIEHIEDIFKIYFTKLNDEKKFLYFCAMHDKEIPFTLNKLLLLNTYGLNHIKHFKFKHIKDNEFEAKFYNNTLLIKVDFDNISSNIHQYLHHIAILLEHEEVIYQRAKRANEILDDLYCVWGASDYYEKLDNLIEVLPNEIEA